MTASEIRRPTTGPAAESSRVQQRVINEFRQHEVPDDKLHALLSKMAAHQRTEPTATAADEKPHGIEAEVASYRARLRAALVPARFQHATFATYQPATPSQERAIRMAERWFEHVRDGQPAMLALIGQTGTGKSHLLYAALNAVIDISQPLPGRRPPYARPWYILANELRYGGRHYFLDDPVQAHEARADLQRARVAFVDEVRVTANTAFDDTELAQWACWVYDSMGCAFVTTNHNPLDDIFGPPGASRFTQVIVEGPDRRHQAKRPVTERL